MNEPTLLPVKPGSLSADDKAALRDAGVIVIEHENPQELRLLRPSADVDAGTMFACAMEALCGPSSDSAVRSAFTRALGAHVAKRRAG